MQTGLSKDLLLPEKYIYMEITKKFSKGEELANAYSHLSGALLAMLGLVLMISTIHGSWKCLAYGQHLVFGATMIILYLSSTLTHILPMGKAKDLFL